MECEEKKTRSVANSSGMEETRLASFLPQRTKRTPGPSHCLPFNSANNLSTVNQGGKSCARKWRRGDVRLFSVESPMPSAGNQHFGAKGGQAGSTVAAGLHLINTILLCTVAFLQKLFISQTTLLNGFQSNWITSAYGKRSELRFSFYSLAEGFTDFPVCTLYPRM